ncbi:DUF2163 domain-containing protein [Fulvimarina sp. 2208YS6-2-32]|uniref:DUF2163 domain-containing protein n=1 Tax=Fulvimarina uroteuthidis TaxID=3098149 RepID=A0ABU5I2W8_9HYPH|nr:DUF2163 domain-containing protein [Fulvimarina sp. 2208YS6-2-32]MDY8109118.1 DUF2163 domain-containing protein [Fulvimarina sp. 2208YS6-2-32]
MKRFPAALERALEGPATTLAECWRITRRDGVVLGFTDHDEDLTFAGTLFEARTGLSASETESELGLSSETREVSGALSSARIEEDDIAAGRYDGASVETFLVDWTDPGIAHARTDVQTVGEIVRDDLAFTVELRSRMADLDRVRGRLYRRECDAALGDHRCRLDLAGKGYTRRATVLSSKEGFVTIALDAAVQPDRYRHGRMLIEDGRAKGVARQIANLTPLESAAYQITLTGALPVLPAPGDQVSVSEGCDKRFATCRDRFANAANFRGFPHLPGSDAVLGVAKTGALHDGQPLVR